VIVINCRKKIKLTGKKQTDKNLLSPPGSLVGLKQVSAGGKLRSNKTLVND